MWVRLQYSRPMIRRVYSVVFAALVILTSPVVQTQENHPAKVLVESAVSDILEVYENESSRLISDPEYLQAKIDELIVPYLDLEAMTQRVVGKFWRRADEDQQQQLVKQFSAFLDKTYAQALTEYNGETVSFEPFTLTDQEDRATVRSKVNLGTGLSIPVLFKLQEEDGWRIYDVEVYGLSLLNMLRIAFSSEIERGGIDGLIQTLKERSR